MTKFWSPVLLPVILLHILLLVTFVRTAVSQNEDLVFDPDIKTLIETHRQNSLPHRMKRGFWDFLGGDDMEESSTPTSETSVEFDDQETGQDQEAFPLFERDDMDGQQTDYDDEFTVKRTSSQERTLRQSGEDPNVKGYRRSLGDDEDASGSGDIDHEGSAEVDERVPYPYPEPSSETPSYPFTPRRCNPETEFSCRSDDECLPISARCDGLLQCIDESDEADCSPTETVTTTEVPIATTDRVESLLKAVEQKLARIDDLNESVQQLTGAVKDLTVTNKCLREERAELRKVNAELGKRLEDQDQRVAGLEATLSKRSTIQSASPMEQRFMELECQAFATDLIIARKKYFP